MKKLLIIMMVLSLCSCNFMDKIVGTDYWEEVHIEPYAYYDSSNQMPRKFMKTARMIIYMTDSTDTKQCNVIWGDTCGFVPGELLYVRYERVHSPSAGGAGGWKGNLINRDENPTYVLYDTKAPR